MDCLKGGKCKDESFLHPLPNKVFVSELVHKIMDMLHLLLLLLNLLYRSSRIEGAQGEQMLLGSSGAVAAPFASVVRGQ